MTGLELVTALVAMFVGLLFWVYRNVTSLNYWKKRGVPYVKPSLFFGNIKDIVLYRKSQSDVFQELYNKLDGHKFGGIFEFTAPSVMLRDRDLVDCLLVHDFQSFHDRGLPYDPEFEPLSANLINVEGNMWRNLRCKLTPTFSTGKLKAMFGQMSKCSEDLVSFIEKHMESDNPFQTKVLAGRYTINVVASCTFGLEYYTTSDDVSHFQTMVNKIFSSSRLINARMFLKRNYPKLAKMLKIKLMPQESETYFIDLVKETLKYREENNIERNDVLQTLLRLKQQEESGQVIDVDREEFAPEDAIINQFKYSLEDRKFLKGKDRIFTDECLAAQAFVFLATGSDSVAGSTSYSLYTVAKHPDVQIRLQEEIDSVLRNHGGTWSYEAIKDMIYLDMVIQETLRLYPSSPMMLRKCTKAYVMPDSDIVLEKGINIVVPIQALQNDPRYFDLPDKFIPERFKDNNFRPSGCYLPFGHGPRVCIAMRFAILEIKVCVARILSRYRVAVNPRTVDPMKFKVGAMMLEPEGGMWLDFHRRNT